MEKLKINAYQKNVLVTAAIVLGLSLLVVPVMAVHPNYDRPDTFSFLEYVLVGSLFPGSRDLFDPHYTLNVLVLAAEWMMIGMATGFGLWIAGRMEITDAIKEVR